ncbi:MAG TPA: DUF2807 domain-containing protein [Brumimicrobium sp.]|nr:DUF2807 domain-containing protein [Brumimicrobium sp.]
MKIKTILLILILGLFACKKKEERVCFKNKGEETTMDVSIDYKVDSLALYDDLFYTLIQGQESKIVLSGGENLLPHVKIDFEDGKLTVRNGNKCNFLRSFKNKIHVKIYVDSIENIYYEGSRQLISKDTLISNELRLVITDGAGDVDLTLRNGYTSAVVTHGFGNFTLRGDVLNAFLNCSTNSYCDTRLLHVTNTLIVNSNTVGHMLVNANTNYFNAKIRQKGDVKYIGTPVSKTVERTGNGELIDLNN